MSAPLPTIDGVGPSRKWLPPGAWKTILAYLTEQFPRVDTKTWIERMQRGSVVDESGCLLNAESAYRAGACIFYYREVEPEREIPFSEVIIYQDEHIVVADKPHFLPVVPSGRFVRDTLLARLQRALHLDTLVPVHRIDRDTAGLVLFSVDPQTRGQYASLYQQRRVTKHYHALVQSTADHVFPITYRSRIVRGDPFFRMQEGTGDANSETVIEVIGRSGAASLCRLTPVTGRKHQLRLHMAALGMPIINDRLYPEISASGADDFAQPLQLLAKSLRFVDPLTGVERCFESHIDL